MTPPLPYKDVLITTATGKQYVGYYAVWSKKYRYLYTKRH